MDLISSQKIVKLLSNGMLVVRSVAGQGASGRGGLASVGWNGHSHHSCVCVSVSVCVCVCV